MKGSWFIFASVLRLLVNQKVQKFLLRKEHETTPRRGRFYYILEQWNGFYVQLSLYLNCPQHIKFVREAEGSCKQHHKSRVHTWLPFAQKKTWFKSKPGFFQKA